MTDSDIEELFGENVQVNTRKKSYYQPTGRKPGRKKGYSPKTGKKATPIEPITKELDGEPVSDLGDGRKINELAILTKPVTLPMLAAIFKSNQNTIIRRLIDCPFRTVGKKKLYDLAEAASYIVKPRMTTDQFIRTLHKANLPPEINLAFWNAQRARLKFKLEAQEAWATEDVLRVFGDVFLLLKDSLQMAEEELRERAKLSDKQVEELASYMDNLRLQLREKLVDMPARQRTPSLADADTFGNGGSLDDGSLDDLPDDE